MLQSLYLKDKRDEELFTAFLERDFFRPMEEIIQSPMGNVLFVPVTDRSLQYHGADLYIMEGRENSYTQVPVDIKAQLHYLGNPLPTFAFELSYIGRDGTVKSGWFLNARKITQAYMLCWPDGERIGEDITLSGADIMMVSRIPLKAALASCGLTDTELATRDELIRKNGISGSLKTEIRGVRFFYSSNTLAEAPIQLVIHRDILKRLAFADIHVQANPDGTVALKGNWLKQKIDSIVRTA